MRPGGNPDLKEHRFKSPSGVRVPRDKVYSISVEPPVRELLRHADKEKIRAAIIKSLIEQGFAIDSCILEYYLFL